jgi:tetratricopeptide (TPR) repeat protein
MMPARSVVLRHLLVLVILLFSSAAFSAGGSKTVSSWLYKQLEGVEKQLSTKEYAKATILLQKTLKKLPKKNYEQAVVLRSLASVNAMQGDYEKAIPLLEKSLATGALPKEQAARAYLNLGQLYMADGQYKKTIAIMEKWLHKTEKPAPQDYILLAQAHAQLKHYKKALPLVDKAISASKKPVESWYQLQLALNYELERFQQCSLILQKLVRFYPDKKRYWKDLVGVYQQLKDFKSALAVMELAYQKSLLVKSKELTQLANLYLYLDTPLKASQLLEKELKGGRVERTEKNLELFANSLIQAKEYKRSEEPLREAAELSKKGRLYIRLARIQIEQELWKKAQKNLAKGLKKGKLRKPGEAWLLMGVSCHEQDKPICSRRAFNKATNFKRQKKSAQQWLQYLAEEEAQ